MAMAERTEAEVLAKCRIPWDEFRQTYNTRHKKKFKSVKLWLSHMLKKHSGSTVLVSQELLVSQSALYNMLIDLGLHERKRAGAVKPGTYKARFLAITPEKMKNMTFIDLIEALPGIGEPYLYQLLQDYRRDFKHRSPEPPNKKYNVRGGSDGK